MIWFPRWSVFIGTRIAIAVHTVIVPTISTRILTTIHTTRSSVGSSWVRGRHTATAGIATFGRACPLFTIAMCPVSTPCVLLTHYSSLLLWFHWRSRGGLCHFSLCQCLLLRIWLWILQAKRNSLGISIFKWFSKKQPLFLLSKNPPNNVWIYTRKKGEGKTQKYILFHYYIILSNIFQKIRHVNFLLYIFLKHNGSGESFIKWNYYIRKKSNTYIVSAPLNKVQVQDRKSKWTLHQPSYPFPQKTNWNKY